MVDSLEFGKYLPLKKAGDGSLMPQEPPPISQLADGSFLQMPSGATYQIDLHKSVVDSHDHGQFIGSYDYIKIIFEISENFFVNFKSVKFGLGYFVL